MGTICHEQSIGAVARMTDPERTLELQVFEGDLGAHPAEGRGTLGRNE